MRFPAFLASALLVLFGLSASAQSTKELKGTFKDYFEAFTSHDHERVVEFIYPGLFEKMPKERMIMSLDRNAHQMTADSTIEVKLHKVKLKHVSDFVQVEGASYALIDYTMYIDMKVLERNETKAYQVMEFLKDTFKRMYGDENVKYDRDKATLRAKQTSSLYAIWEPHSGEWKFLEKNEKMAELLPEEAMSKLP